MARINNLSNFLTDVATAIKQKTGTSELIPAAEFDTEILSIVTGGNYQEKEVTLTENDSYTLTPEVGYDAFDEVIINVNVPSENLDNVITAQENKLDALETILENKISGTAKSNIFVQDTEPVKKDGIWLQMNDTTAEHYVCDSNISLGGWSTTTQMPYSFINGTSAVVGTDIYLFGGNDSPQTVYKYDTLTTTYTRMSDIPYAINEFVGGKAVPIGSDVYLFGGGDNGTNAYKYSTLTDTYTKLTDVPERFNSRKGGTTGTDIYLLGVGTNSQSAYKYDILTDTYTQLSDSPVELHRSVGDATVGTNIYLFYESWDSVHYKYNMLTDTYTSISAMPMSYSYPSATSVSTDIYLLGPGNGVETNTYKYDTLTDTYTRMDDIPYNFYEGSAETVGTNVYIFGGQEGANSNKYDTVISTYDTNNTVVIEQGTTYRTNLIKTDFEANYQPTYTFDDVYFYTTQGGLDDSMPVYYGDGTQWINIKNPIQGGAE